MDHAGRKSVPFHVVTPRPPLSASLEPCLNGLFWDKFWGTWLLAFFISLVAVVVAFFTMALWLPHSWYRALLYPGGRPNAFARTLNAANSWAGAIGIAPSVMVSLETRGRLSGRVRCVPLVIANLEGERYVVSMLGEKPDWVRNVRASGGEALMRHGIVEAIRLEEVAVPERAPILQAYLKRAPGARPHFDIAFDAPIEEFVRIAPLVPVFRIVPLPKGFRADIE